MIRFLFWLCLLLLIPGMLLRVGVGSAGVQATDILVPITACTWLWYRTFVERSFPVNKVLLPGFFFAGFAFLTFWFGVLELQGFEVIHAFSYIVRFITMLIFGWIAQDLFRTEKDRTQFFRGLFLISGIVILLGFLQFYILPDISEYSNPGEWDPHTGRLLGTWMDPNFMAGFLGFLLPMIVASWYRTPSRVEKIWLSVLILAALYALFLTFSRSGYLAAATGLGFFFLLRDPKVLLLGILLATIGVSTNERAQKRLGEFAGTVSSTLLGNTDEVDPTANLRIQSWLQTLELAKKYPVMGVGYNAYRYRAADEGIVDENYFSAGGSDSTLLTILVTTGGIGLLMFLYFFGNLWIRNFLAYRRTQEPLFLGLVSGLCALFVHSLFVNSLLFPFIFLPLIAIAGILENRNS